MELLLHWRNQLLVASIAAVLGLAPPLATNAHAQAQAAGASAADEKGIRDATALFYDAMNSALHGDLAPIGVVWSHSADVTDLGGVGDRALGWNAVRADYQNMSRLYPDGRIAPQDVIVVVGIELGYSVCNETGQLRSPEGPIVHFTRRATNIFRREGGKWKMVHHHADPGSLPSQGPSR
ncbi:MAG: YybH family protein [Candidatus Binatus sp.]